AALQVLHSSPTRRSSDLAGVPLAELVTQGDHALLGAGLLLVAAAAAEDRVEAALDDGVQQRLRLQLVAGAVGALQQATVVDVVRSEEHTSELQSRFDLVC